MIVMSIIWSVLRALLGAFSYGAYLMTSIIFSAYLLAKTGSIWVVRGTCLSLWRKLASAVQPLCDDEVTA
ncbi:hypothetical protein Q5752_005980 [Cryptotrichosporon argae]